MNINIRFANENDSVLILDFIKELAVFEGMGDQVFAAGEDIRTSLFEKKQAEVLIAETDGAPVAFALFYPVYSTFWGHANLFLEDLFVREGFRGKGAGSKLIRRLAEIALERGAKRLDWYVFDENEKGAAFYKGFGAVQLTDRRTYRLNNDELKQLAVGGRNHA